MLSDGKQAAKEIGIKIEDVGDKMQRVIDGARSLSIQ